MIDIKWQIDIKYVPNECKTNWKVMLTHHFRINIFSDFWVSHHLQLYTNDSSLEKSSFYNNSALFISNTLSLVISLNFIIEIDSKFPSSSNKIPAL
jgi:hypothetical protein